MNPSFPRRWFLGGAAFLTGKTLLAGPQISPAKPSFPSLPHLPEKLQALLPPLEPFFTPQEKFQDVSRGQPIPHTLSETRRREVGLSRETWSLEIVSDPDHPASIGKPLVRAKDGMGLGTAIDFAGLMALAPNHSVRVAKVMTCLNMGCPLGMGIWEGIPLRTLVWKTAPTANLRRVFYEGFHNNEPKQIFRSSLPIGRVLEDYDDLPPVLVCYKLNGHWLSPERGGPVRMLVPEAYGFKSIKWLSKITLSNLAVANDTYIEGNNDIDSPLKTFADTFPLSGLPKPQVPFPVTGYAQLGISGLSKVQIWVQPEPGPKDPPWPTEDPYFTKAPWTDAFLLPPPKDWGGDFPQGKFPGEVLGFDKGGIPQTWPMRLGKVHWAALIPGLPSGNYILRSRTIDAKGQAQPMPRPFAKSGRCAIEAVRIQVGT